jgi:hypothetical protein
MSNDSLHSALRQAVENGLPGTAASAAGEKGLACNAQAVLLKSPHASRDA